MPIEIDILVLPHGRLVSALDVRHARGADNMPAARRWRLTCHLWLT